MTRECRVRFCERLGVKLPGATLPAMTCAQVADFASPRIHRQQYDCGSHGNPPSSLRDVTLHAVIEDRGAGPDVLRRPAVQTLGVDPKSLRKASTNALD